MTPTTRPGPTSWGWADHQLCRRRSTPPARPGKGSPERRPTAGPSDCRTSDCRTSDCRNGLWMRRNRSKRPPAGRAVPASPRPAPGGAGRRSRSPRSPGLPRPAPVIRLARGGHMVTRPDRWRRRSRRPPRSRCRRCCRTRLRYPAGPRRLHAARYGHLRSRGGEKTSRRSWLPRRPWPAAPRTHHHFVRNQPAHRRGGAANVAPRPRA